MDMPFLLEPPIAARSLRILAVVELGANWGHYLRILPVARELLKRGHLVGVAVSDMDAANKVFVGTGVEVLLCPSALRLTATTADSGVVAYAEILDRCVFGSDGDLTETMRQWDELLAVWKPDVLLTDFAPGALFAAHLHRLPLVQFVTGWEAPPRTDMLPVIRPWQRPDLPAIRALEARLVEMLGRWCDRFDVSRFKVLSDLYGVGTQLLAVLPESDHFGPRAEGCFIGPVFSDAHGLRVEWQSRPENSALHRVLIYLAPDVRNFSILHSFRSLPVEVVAILPKVDPRMISALSTPRIRIWNEALQLDALLPSADLVINNAGHGMIGASLLAGVPMLTLPRTVEQAIITERLELSGAGLSLLKIGGPTRAGPIAMSTMTQGNLRRAARAISEKYAGASQLRSLLAVIDAVERAAARPQGEPRASSDLGESSVDSELDPVHKTALV